MKLNCNSFFNGRFKKINLNKFFKTYEISGNKPEVMQNHINKYYLNNTYGGYGENRKEMWKGTYIEKNRQYYHLGIDINVPKNTPICCPFDAYLVDRFVSKDKNIGWGGRLILRTKHESHKYFLLLCHLNPATMTKKTFIKKGEILGQVGTWPTNGNVFEHLHVQYIPKNLPLKDIDGYGSLISLNYFPNPFSIDYY